MNAYIESCFKRNTKTTGEISMTKTIDLKKYTKTDKQGNETKSKTYITYVNDPEATEEHKVMLNAGYQKVMALRAQNVDIERLVFEELLAKL